jgi:hypothetical protein
MPSPLTFHPLVQDQDLGIGFMLVERLFMALQPPLSQPPRGVHDVPHAVMTVRRTLAGWRIGGHQSARDLVSLMAASGHDLPIDTDP